MAIVLIPHHKPIPALYADTHRLRHRGIGHTAWNAILYRWPNKPAGYQSIPLQLQLPAIALNRLPKTIHKHKAHYYWLLPLNHDYLTLRISKRTLRRTPTNYTSFMWHHAMILGTTIKMHTTNRGTTITIRGVKTHWPKPPTQKRWK